MSTLMIKDRVDAVIARLYRGREGTSHHVVRGHILAALPELKEFQVDNALAYLRERFPHGTRWVKGAEGLRSSSVAYLPLEQGEIFPHPQEVHQKWTKQDCRDFLLKHEISDFKSKDTLASLQDRVISHIELVRP